MGIQSASKAAGAAGALLGFCALFLAAYYPDQRPALWALSAVSAAGILFFAVAERRWLARASASRAARHGANAAVLTLAVVGILVIGNVLGARHNRRWDLTQGKIHTLSEQTRKVLRGLRGEVTVTAFYPEGREVRAEIERLLQSYREESALLKVDFFDPDRNPEKARQFGIRENGTTVFTSGSHTFRINQSTEESVTNALVRVTREGKKSVYFLSGHGEHGIDDTQRTGYSAVKKMLEDQGFGVKELLLLRAAEVPKDCDVLVIAGPTKPLVDAEAGALSSYLGRGGRVLLMVDPMTETGLDSLLSQWGAVVRDDGIIDNFSRFGSHTNLVIADYPPHEITRDFLNVATVVPFARSIDRAQTLPDGVTYAPIAKTSGQSWGETDLKSEPTFDANSDHRGPLTVAALFEKKEVFARDEPRASAQILLVGDSDLADNATVSTPFGNADLFQNMVSYLSKEEDLISVRARDESPTPLMLTRAQAATLFYGTAVAGPLLLAVAGVGMWWRRRKL